MAPAKSERRIENRRIGDNLKKLRVDRNLTQEAIADELEIHRQSYAKIENGQAELTIRKAVRLAEYYKLSLDKLIGRGSKDPLSVVAEGAPNYNTLKSANITFVLGGEGKNSPAAEKFLNRLGDLLTNPEQREIYLDRPDDEPGQ